jgi:hypothetical protein
MFIGTRAEVEQILGRALIGEELKKFKRLRRLGYANPYDLATQIEEA